MNMNQSERRQYLIRELIAEDKEYQRLAIPKDEGGQKVLLRALMNVRAPKPCGEELFKDPGRISAGRDPERGHHGR